MIRNLKIFKHIEAKQHVVKQGMNYQLDQGRNKKKITWNQTKINIQLPKIYGAKPKQS